MEDLQVRTWMEPLAAREIQILGLISEGLSNREISKVLHLTPETIKWYNKQIYGKLGASNRAQATKIAAERGLLDLNKYAHDWKPAHLWENY
jgi:ATP/maltotriose-dependent transcriptional regulator MalT